MKSFPLTSWRKKVEVAEEVGQKPIGDPLPQVGLQRGLRRSGRYSGIGGQCDLLYYLSEEGAKEKSF